MRLTVIWLNLALVILITLLNPAQSAIVFRGSDSDDAPSADSDLLEQPYRDLPELLKTEDENPSLPIATRFILLTTGEKIKLYPFTPSTRFTKGLSNSLSHNEYHFIVKPAEIDTNQDSFYQRFGDTIFSRWLIERQANKNSTSRSNNKFIFPGEETDEDFEEYSGGSGWQKPRITSVDYFFDERFCPSPRSRLSDKCLIITWLDDNNKFVRLASLDLEKNPILYQDPQDTVKHHGNPEKTKILWLQEHPPIDIRLALVKSHHLNNSVDIRLFSLTTDKLRNSLYVSAGLGHSALNLILSGSPKPQRSTGESSQLENEYVHSFTSCAFDENSESENLSFDEPSGFWFFYFNRISGGRIVALNVDPTRIMTPKERLGNLIEGRKIVVKELPANDETTFSRQKIVDEQRGPSGIALDSQKRRIYWLSSENEVFSCDYVGEDVRLVRRLPTKPVLRSPRTMHIFDRTLYISDASKNSLFAYQLDEEETKDPAITHGTQSIQNVLLIETSNIVNFRILDTSGQSRLNSQSILIRSQGLSIWKMLQLSEYRNSIGELGDTLSEQALNDLDDTDPLLKLESRAETISNCELCDPPYAADFANFYLLFILILLYLFILVKILHLWYKDSHSISHKDVPKIAISHVKTENPQRLTKEAVLGILEV